MESSAPALKAVVLTGTRNNQNPLLAGTSLQNKVLLPVGGKPMVQSVLETIAATKYRPESYVSTSDPDVEALREKIPFKAIPSEAKAVQSLLRSLDRLPQDAEWVLFVSGDHPLLTPEMVEHFVEESIRRDLVLAVAVVNGKLVSERYPESRRTYFFAKDGPYSGGNMYLIHKPRFMGNAATLETIDANRKKPWKSIFLLDIPTVLQLLFRRLDMHEVAERASRVIGSKTGIVSMPYAECCMDVDKPSDKEIAERILAARTARHEGGSAIPDPSAPIANPI